jgi:hypothetical protein
MAEEYHMKILMKKKRIIMNMNNLMERKQYQVKKQKRLLERKLKSLN